MRFERPEVVLILLVTLIFVFHSGPGRAAEGGAEPGLSAISLDQSSPGRGQTILAQRVAQPISLGASPGGGRSLLSLLRSAAVPGWGQLCDGKRKRGLFIMTLWTGTATGLVFLFDDYDRKLQDYDNSVIDYETADFINVEAKREIMREKYDQADTAYQNTRILSAVTAGIWGLAVLDWLIFAPPAGGLSRSDNNSSRLQLTAHPGEIHRVGVNVSF